MSKEVTYETSPHWSARPWGSLGGLFLLLVGAALAVVTHLAQSQTVLLRWTAKLPPAAWEKMWLGFVVAAALAGAGLLVLLVTWIRLRSVRVRIRGGQIEEARGIFSVRVRDIRMETAGRIAAYLGLELKPTRRPGRARKGR